MSAVDKKLVRAWVRQQSRPAKRAAAPATVLSCLVSAVGVTQAWEIALALGHAVSSDYEKTVSAVTGFAVLSLLRAVLQCLADVYAAHAGVTARRRLRHEVLSAILTEGPAILRRKHSAELAALIVDRIEALNGYFSRWIPTSLTWFAMPAIVCAGVALANPHAALIMGVCGVSVPFAQAIFGIGAALASRNQFLAMIRLQTRFLDRVKGISTIVLAGAAEREATALARSADELRQRTMRVLRVAFLSSAAIDIAMVCAIIGIVVSQVHILLHADSGHLPALVDTIFALVAVPEFFGPLRSLALAYQDKAHAAGAAEAMHDLKQVETVRPALERDFSSHLVTLRFDQVTYGWAKDNAPVIEDLSFEVKAGETLILDGPSGSGKSTIIELLLGFATPTSGRVLFNDRDVATISPGDLAAHIAWIGQRPLLFAGTLRDNILFAKPTASAAELEQAIHAAALDVFVHELPNGLDTLIGEGGFGLSGGQAQRVAISRAFLKDAPVLLLDEPTAHLDPEAERAIIETLRRLSKGRSVVLCSHSRAVRELGTSVIRLCQHKRFEVAA